MARGIDGTHVPQAEVPNQVRINEGYEKSAGGRIHMDAHGDPCRLVVSFHQLIKPLDIIEFSCIGDAQNAHDADGIIVHVIHHRIHVHAHMAGA